MISIITEYTKALECPILEIQTKISKLLNTIMGTKHLNPSVVFNITRNLAV